jgi:peptidoglycan L-alanyl-D-glutamate endopeptidase CwlK
MPRFSNRSKLALTSCDVRLQLVMETAVRHIDFTVLEGHRGQAAQNKAFNEGYSKVRWPNGQHNSMPSKAVDIAPWPLDWSDSERFVYQAGFIMATAAALGIGLRWGGDWNRDGEVKDEKFRDLGHFELVD